MTDRKTLCLLALATTFVLPGCSGGGSAASEATPTEVTASGTLNLNGPDTAMVGDTLTVGDAALLLGPETVQTYFFIDELSTVSGFEYAATSGITGTLVPGDVENGFVMNVIDAVEASGFLGISMAIRVMGADFSMA